MRSSLIFLILIISSVVIESSILQTFFYPINLISLGFVIGVILFHSLPMSYGIAWFVLYPIVQLVFGFTYMPIITFPLLAIIALLLLQRSFARRSIFGLFGFAITLYTCMLFINWVLGFDLYSHYPPIQSLSLLIIINIILLFLGFSIVQKLAISNNRDLFPG